MRAAAIALAFLGSACVSFQEDGLYACDLGTGKDCVVCDPQTGWCRDYSAHALGVQDLRAVYGLSSDQVWAVGDGGVVVFWNGKKWTRLDAGTSESLLGVWAGGVRDVWAVGDNATYTHYDGTHWLARRADEMRPNAAQITAISGASSSWVVAGNDYGDIAWWNDLATSGLWEDFSWAVVPVPTTYAEPVRAIWSDPSWNVWAATEYGTVLFTPFDTSSSLAPKIVPNPDPQQNALKGMYGTGWLAFIAGGNGTILRADPTGDTSVTPNGPYVSIEYQQAGPDLNAICGTSSYDMIAVGDGGRVVETDAYGGFGEAGSLGPENLHGVWCNGTDVWAVGENGIIFHRPR